MIKIYDNLLPDYFADSVEKLHMSNVLNWYFQPSTVGDKYGKDGKQEVFDYNKVINSPQFVHLFFENVSGPSQYVNQVENVMKHVDINLEDLKIYRIKSNLNVNQTGYNQDNIQPPHTDSSHKSCSSLIYYVNDADGDTVFFDDDMNIVDRVSPKKNRAVMFPSNMIHAGSNPIKSNMRIVINFVFNTEKIDTLGNYYKLGSADEEIIQEMDKMFERFKLGEKV